eukprot:CAMPEP_0170152628 /NCGR_PEP_ID=MMETSP0033_2-20121228/53061_1 /TAXON_ID=195969 /ORGANISM="Dolichomastix tenuilepis, Strain CCMP3274" /LENGTH=52 /DNA_ID=CAMNT_0010389787 /DNA_START=192 /DNA_END=347 /DNA_ORIENTATION=-
MSRGVVSHIDEQPPSKSSRQHRAANKPSSRQAALTPPPRAVYELHVKSRRRS